MRFQILAILVLGAMGVLNVRPAWAEASDVEGTWRGESLCATEASACHNEGVIYYIRQIPHREDVVVIKADKIVNGKPVTMGTGEWRYDRARNTLEWKMPEQVWLLRISGSRMEGTLKHTDGSIFRNVTLEKDR